MSEDFLQPTYVLAGAGQEIEAAEAALFRPKQNPALRRWVREHFLT